MLIFLKCNTRSQSPYFQL